MTSRALAWRTISARPARTALAVTGVTVIGALLFTMLLLSRGLLVSFRDLLDNAGYDVRVVASDGIPMIRMPIPRAAEFVEAVAKLPEVQEVAMARRERTVLLVPGKQPAAITLIAVSRGAERHAWHMISGVADGLSRPDVRRKAGATTDIPPLIVSRSAAHLLDLQPGSVVRLRVTIPGTPSALPAITFRVAGIAEFELEPGDDLIASTTMEAFTRAEGQGAKDDAELVLITSRPALGPAAAVEAIRQLRPDVRAYSNQQIVSQFNQNGFAYFRQISMVLSSITLGFAFLLIATVLSVSVNQRLSEVAALRALGLARQRIAAILLWESAWLVGVGGLLSIPVGGLLAVELDRMLRSMPGVPERIHFFVFETRAVVLQIMLLAATAIGAAVYPIWIATRLPIAATLRRETVS